MSAAGRLFSWACQFPERIIPVSCSRGSNMDADFRFIFLLAVWPYSCPNLCKPPLQLLSFLRVEVSQQPRFIRWRRKPGCLNGLYTDFERIFPFSVPRHTAAYKGTRCLQVLMWASMGFCRIKQLASHWLPLWRNGLQLSPAANSVTTHRSGFHPSKCCCHPPVVLFPVLLALVGFLPLVLVSSLILYHSFTGILVRHETHLMYLICQESLLSPHPPFLETRFRY